MSVTEWPKAEMSKGRPVWAHIDTSQGCASCCFKSNHCLSRDCSNEYRPDKVDVFFTERVIE